MGKNIISGEVKLNSIFKAIYIALIAYIFLLPFYYLPYTVFGHFKLPLLKYFPLVLIFSLLFLSFHKKYSAWYAMMKNRINLLVVIYFIFTLLSGITTFYYPVSVMKNIYYCLTGVTVYFILLSWGLEKSDIEFILKVFVVIGGIVSIYGIICFILGKDPLFINLATSDHIAIRRSVIDPLYDIHLKGGRISSTLGNPHFLGTFLSFVFPFSIYFWVNADREKKFFNFKWASVALFIATLLTFSIGAYIAVAAFFIYACSDREFYSRFVDHKIIKKAVFILAILLAIVLFLRILGFVLTLNGFNIPERIGKIDIGLLLKLDRFTQRWKSLELAWSNCITNYGFGIGIGKISRGLSSLYIDNLDNFYCTSLVESGIIPTFIMFVVFFVFLKQAMKKIKEKAENKQLIIILLVSWGSFFVNMLFWDVYYHPAMRICFWSLIAMIFQLCDGRKRCI